MEKRAPFRYYCLREMVSMAKSKTALLLSVIFLWSCATQTLSLDDTRRDRQDTVASEWVYLGGPIGGLGYDIRFHPNNKNTLLVSDANAGVFKSVDGGFTWQPKNEGITTRGGQAGGLIPVFCLTIDTRNPDIIWCGTQNILGVYKSTDGGEHWTRLVNGIEEENGITFRGIYPDPTDSDTVYAAGEYSSWAWAESEQPGVMFDRTRGFVYKTTDGGQNWKKIWEGDNLTRYVCINPRDTDIIYVSSGIFDREAANSDPNRGIAGGVGILKSLDGGETWQVLNEKNGLDCLYIGSLFMHPDDPEILLAGGGHDFYSHPHQVRDRFPSSGSVRAVPGGVYLTTNGGKTWKKTLPVEIIESVEFFASDPSIAYAGNEFAFYISRDGGRTWKNTNPRFGTHDSAWGPEDTVAGFPIDIAIDPDDPNRFFVNNYGGGNFLTEDGGVSWKTASQGYSGANVRGGLVVAPDNPAKIFAGARSGLFVSDDYGETWRGRAFRPARVAEINALGVHPGDSDTVLASPWNLGHMIVKSSDGGQTWKRIGLPVGREQQTLTFAFAPSDPETVYAGAGKADYRLDMRAVSERGSGVFRSDDAGDTWRSVSGGVLEDKTVAWIAVHPDNPDYLCAAALQHGLYASEDGGTSWNRIFDKQKTVLFTAINNLNPDTVAAGTDDGLYLSHDQGKTWAKKTKGIEPEAIITSVIFDTVNPNRIYIADFRSGVYYSNDLGESWHKMNQGLVNRAVRFLTQSKDGEYLFAATHGAGVFRINL